MIQFSPPCFTHCHVCNSSATPDFAKKFQQHSQSQSPLHHSPHFHSCTLGDQLDQDDDLLEDFEFDNEINHNPMEDVYDDAPEDWFDRRMKMPPKVKRRKEMQRSYENYW